MKTILKLVINCVGNGVKILEYPYQVEKETPLYYIVIPEFGSKTRIKKDAIGVVSSGSFYTYTPRREIYCFEEDKNESAKKAYQELIDAMTKEADKFKGYVKTLEDYRTENRKKREKA